MGIMQQAWREHRGLLVAACLYFAAVSTIAVFQGAQAEEFLLLIGMMKLAVLSMVLFAGVVIAVMYGRAVVDIFSKQGPDWRAINQLFDSRSHTLFDKRRLVRGFIGLLAVATTLSSIGIAKSLIFWISSYQWDPFFSDLDYALHFNHYPYQGLLTLAQFVPLATILNFAYIAWFIVMFMMCGLCLFCDDNPARRMRYLWSFLICWILIGTVLATIFASGGPIYFSHFQPEIINPYQPLVDHLNHVAETTYLNVISLSPVLLQMTIDQHVIDLNGISAMPSMHITIAWLMVLYAWSFGRKYGLMMLVYFILILAGSVYLGWHYAVDGYAAILLTSIMWWLTGKIISHIYS